ncbi:MAG TPA: hypothetical protein DEP53_01815 [Bacteroidetes bacterium]|nr:hypothetical protein [Bacteroidota bacterium]
MILVRNIFQLKFGKAREAKALIKESEALMKQHGSHPTRYLTDLTGPYYTLVMETTYESLTALEKSQSETMGTKDFSDWYQRFTPLVESGHREIFSVVD